MVKNILNVQIEDGMRFELNDVSPIMDSLDYPGLRVSLDGYLETLKTPIKIDFSTGDAITPHEESYSFRLMFEDRTLSILAYNLETVLAEKLETILSRGTANTRMRDFYDIVILTVDSTYGIDFELLSQALINTLQVRGSYHLRFDFSQTIADIRNDNAMSALWERYQNRYEYARDMTWEEVALSLNTLVEKLRI